MPIVDAQCTKCGANLRVDSSEDALICSYCGAAFVVEKAIRSYNITNNIHADVVNIYEGEAKDFRIRGGVLVTYNGAAMDVVIPDTVAAIGKAAFKGTMVRRVLIPNSVQRIDEEAFQQCAHLEKVTIPNSVTSLGEGAFSGCKSLSELALPEGLTAIANNAFLSCVGLTRIVLPGGVKSIGKASFGGCDRLEEIDLPDEMTEIGELAFMLCSSLKRIAIPNGVTCIESGTFNRCTSLAEVCLSDSVAQIDGGYYGRSLTVPVCNKSPFQVA